MRLKSRRVGVEQSSSLRVGKLLMRSQTRAMRVALAVDVERVAVDLVAFGKPERLAGQAARAVGAGEEERGAAADFLGLPGVGFVAAAHVWQARGDVGHLARGGGEALAAVVLAVLQRGLDHHHVHRVEVDALEQGVVEHLALAELGGEHACTTFCTGFSGSVQSIGSSRYGRAAGAPAALFGALGDVAEFVGPGRAAHGARRLEVLAHDLRHEQRDSEWSEIDGAHGFNPLPQRLRTAACASRRRASHARLLGRSRRQ